MNFLITICARGGSKGIPGKNIKLLYGKPLIWYSIDLALQFQKQFKNVVVALSTDSEDIAKIADEFGVHTDYRRPGNLSDDSSGKIEAIHDILYYQEKKMGFAFDFILDLDVTSPLRNLEDLEKAYNIISNDSQALTLFSVSPAGRSPYFNMVERNSKGYYGLVKESPGTIMTRQSAPAVYELNASFYFYRRSFFETGLKGVITSQSLVYLVPHICFDLDHIIDFEFLSFLLENNKLDFKL